MFLLSPQGRYGSNRSALAATPCSAWRLDDSPSLFVRSALSRYARLCVVDARPTFAARAAASAAGWGGHRKYMNKQIFT